MNKQTDKWGPYRYWRCVHAVLMIGCLLTVLVFESLIVFVSIASISLLFLFCAHRNKNRFFWGGPANWVTLSRIFLILTLGIASNHLSLFVLGLGFAIAACLDGIDGYLARRFNTASDFGAYFDMEADSFYVALTSAVLYEMGLVAFWVLVVGFLHYFFILLLMVMGWSNVPERHFFIAKTIAVVFFLALIAPFFIQHALVSNFLLMACLLIIFSFAHSLYWIYIDAKAMSRVNLPSKDI